ncbi:hypothetical protein [Pedobacter xixiisoli]|uniref:Uncharacterized protein n=1 Tax=Pedobacter xixiisoli TaxID=1476464 RepID=A0A285ZTH5_9SPHI|nr:hypothetical protein [Pedobacter xixiisoli]SOD12932.1 hypothetical protein SAMN06297358_0922 [Pedobacter xixiisoli]
MKNTLLILVAALLVVSFFLANNFAFEFHYTYYIVDYASILRGIAMLLVVIWLILFFTKRTAK